MGEHHLVIIPESSVILSPADVPLGASTVLEPAIAKSVRFAEAPSMGWSILATARQTPGAQAYRQLARKLAGVPEVPEVRLEDQSIDLVTTTAVSQ